MAVFRIRRGRWLQGGTRLELRLQGRAPPAVPGGGEKRGHNGQRGYGRLLPPRPRPVGCLLRIEVAYAAAGQQVLVVFDVDAGATVEVALRQAASHAAFDGLNLNRMPVGVYGKRVDRSRVLRPGDRIELYRPLLLDPKEARRRRALANRGSA
ncbi:MAG: RnfH family protein [Gammaproteobacteria bacterium]|nr:RnfH family protein [Gammaproteobacteria bacterium]MYK27944.1 RnfH family protein [Gammaproteobacteria bacterium]MYK82169.1 RnfH family protein [Gammaproteobacteria bacterium]